MQLYDLTEACIRNGHSIYATLQLNLSAMHFEPYNNRIVILSHYLCSRNKKYNIMKPYIICHMMASIDGRIDCDMTERIGGNEYYEALEQLACDSTLSGRVTMQMHYALPEPFTTDNPAPANAPSVYKAAEANGYTIAIDSRGTLRWLGKEADGLPLLVITSEKVSQAYLDALRQQGISWIAIGKEGIDLSQAVQILNEQFNVKRLAIVGGGHINGAFLRAGLLNEVSIVIGAGIDGRAGMTAVFDGIGDKNYPTTLLKLKSMERVGENSVWLRYSLS